MSNKEPKQIKFIAYRLEGSKREYSNYVEVSKSLIDVSLKFCDIKPPASNEELQQLQKTGILKTAVITEVVLPIQIAEALLGALKTQLERQETKV